MTATNVAAHDENKKPSWLNEHANFIGIHALKAMRVFASMFRDEQQKAYRSRLITCDANGTLKVDTLGTTNTITLNNPGGYLDGITVVVGDLVMVYPANKIIVDTISLPAPGLQLIISGAEAGTNFAVLESKLPWNRFSSTLG